MSAEQKSKSDPLADVVQLCKSGRRSAQQELYEACHQDVYGLMVRMVGRQDAADVTQQVFMQVFRKIDQFQGQSKFKTWLYRLAVNESLQHLRKNKRKQQTKKTHEIPPHSKHTTKSTTTRRPRPPRDGVRRNPSHVLAYTRPLP